MEPSTTAASTELHQENFARLQEEHAKAIHASRERISKWEQFKADYDALQARLQTLPEKVTHDVMVPFGRFAFMPGQLYHTNEILVLLGDNWFAERSAKQAIEIVDRRKEYVAKLLEDEKKQFSDWEARYAFAAEFGSTRTEHEGTFEIREEYKPEEEEKRKAKRYRVPKESRGIPPQKVLPTTASKGGSEKAEGAMEVKSDAEIWIRLDQLEKEEKEWEEMEYRLREGREGQLARAPEDSSEEVEGLTKRKDAGFQTTGVTFSDKSKVLPASTQTQICNLEVENRYTTSASTVAATANRTSQGGDGRGGEDEEGEDSSPLTIKVTHTVPDAVQPPILTEQPVSQELSQEKPLFTSPGDIFTNGCKPLTKESVVQQISTDTSLPRSQPSAKSVRWDPRLVSYSERSETTKEVKKPKAAVQPKGSPTIPFSGRVVERRSIPISSLQTQVQAQEEPTRKVSRFKASRQK